LKLSTINYQLLNRSRKAFISELVRKQSSSRRKREGFTLVELLVVIAIIGILAGMGVATYTRAQARARDAQRKSDLEAIRTALEMYASEHSGQYPGTTGWVKSDAGDEWISDLVPTYIKILPKEEHGTDNLYQYRNDGTSQACTGGYMLRAYMEAEDGQNCSCGSYGGGSWYCVENP
jgi:general secretion pathway protein G